MKLLSKLVRLAPALVLFTSITILTSCVDEPSSSSSSIITLNNSNYSRYLVVETDYSSTSSSIRLSLDVKPGSNNYDYINVNVTVSYEFTVQGKKSTLINAPNVTTEYSKDLTTRLTIGGFGSKNDSIFLSGYVSISYILLFKENISVTGSIERL